MPILSDYSRKRKCAHFLARIPKDHHILEVGAGAGWVGDYLRTGGWSHYTGLDLFPPADVVGDILQWRDLGLAPESFDTIIAFEVVEHVDCWAALGALLRPGGQLMATSPYPGTDWICRLLEYAGLSQQRTSPHSHLIDFRTVPGFELVELRRVGLLAQWGLFRKPHGGALA